MTNKEAIKILEKVKDRIRLDDHFDHLKDDGWDIRDQHKAMRALSTAINKLSLDGCRDGIDWKSIESAGICKARKGKYVIYDSEWLLDHIALETHLLWCSKYDRWKASTVRFEDEEEEEDS